MAINKTRPTRTANRNKHSNNTGYWFWGGITVLIFVLVILFSRNEKKDRLNAQRKELSPPSVSKGKPRVVKMRKQGGVYYMPARINGQELEFIFDTGASEVLISQIEATLLWKQGRLAEEDIIGQVQSQIADGSIIVNTAIILRTVEVAGVILHNIEATVADNIQAPLLLGQSVMSKFGAFTMDYEKSIVTFYK